MSTEIESNAAVTQQEEGTAITASVEQMVKAKRSMIEVREKTSSTSLPSEIKTEDFSKESREILEHFGLECPAMLNVYATSLEDVLLQLTQANNELRREVYRCHTEIDNFQDYRDRNVDDWATVRRLVKSEDWEQVLDVVPTLGH